jgi:hypothetical protein
MSETAPPTSSPLPPLYDRWASELLKDGAIPHERYASCDHCAMLDPSGGPASAGYYHPQVKCCTFQPLMFNFLLGGVLDDPTVLARPEIERQIDQAPSVTPIGILPHAGFSLLYRHSSPAFGRSLSLRCSYYIEEGGLCGVWRHRQSMCATWYCKHERAEVGMRFWRALHRLLTHIEKQLATWCVLELDPGREALELLMPLHRGNAGDAPLQGHELDRLRDPAEHRRRWGRWAGREREFYRRAGKLVAGLSWKQVLAHTGPEVQVAAQLLQEAHAELGSEELPARLRQGKMELLQIGKQKSKVVGYSGLDPIELPRRLLDLFDRFDGRETTVVLKELDREGDPISPSLVRRLVDFGILRGEA